MPTPVPGANDRNSLIKPRIDANKRDKQRGDLPAEHAETGGKFNCHKRSQRTQRGEELPGECAGGSGKRRILTEGNEGNEVGNSGQNLHSLRLLLFNSRLQVFLCLPMRALRGLRSFILCDLCVLLWQSRPLPLCASAPLRELSPPFSL